MPETIIVDDFEFFRAADDVVRKGMDELEPYLLPPAEQAVKDAGFEVDNERKVEGRYHKNPELQRYFRVIRTLQEKFTEKITPAIRKLHDVYTHPVFGSLGQGQPTAINPKPEHQLSSTKATISPVIDPVTVASFRLQPNWTIEGIMKEVEGLDLGTCLVGLAALVDRENKNANGSYNPVATTMACETTVLSRMKITYRGMPDLPAVDWRVSSDVEDYAREVIAGYNDLIRQHGPSGLELAMVTPRNVAGILEDADSMIRCVNLNKTEIPGKPPMFYHWAVVEMQGKPYAVEFWSPEMTTTKEWQDNDSMRQKYAMGSPSACYLKEGEVPVFGTKTGRLLRIEKEGDKGE